MEPLKERVQAMACRCLHCSFLLSNKTLNDVQRRTYNCIKSVHTVHVFILNSVVFSRGMPCKIELKHMVIGFLCLIIMEELFRINVVMKLMLQETTTAKENATGKIIVKYLPNTPIPHRPRIPRIDTN